MAYIIFLLDNAALESWKNSWTSYSIRYGECKVFFGGIKEKVDPRKLGHKTADIDRLSVRKYKFIRIYDSFISVILL